MPARPKVLAEPRRDEGANGFGRVAATQREDGSRYSDAPSDGFGMIVTDGRLRRSPLIDLRRRLR